jgi:hypothetical protein
MRKVLGLVLTLLAVSMLSFSQYEADMTEDPVDPNQVASMTFCLPIVYYTDSIVTLKCDGVYIEIPPERLVYEEFVIVIKPNAKRTTALLPGKKVINYFLAEENNDPALKE